MARAGQLTAGEADPARLGSPRRSVGFAESNPLLRIMHSSRARLVPLREGPTAGMPA